MTTEEKGHYVELAKLCQRSFEQRRSYEWKIAFGLWGGIAVFTWFVVENADSLGGISLVWVSRAYVTVALVWLFLWQLPLHGANAQDKDWKHYYAKRAEGLDANQPAHSSRFRQIVKPWTWCQTLITALFLTLSYVLLTALEPVR